MYLAIAAVVCAAVFVLVQAAQPRDQVDTSLTSPGSSEQVPVDGSGETAGTVPNDVYSPGGSVGPPPATIVSATTPVATNLSAPGATTVAVPDNAAPPSTTTPSILNRTIPKPAVASSPPAPGPWANMTHTSADGMVSTEVGCADDTSAGALDAFFAERVGPVLGEDYQHVYPLPGGRYLWLFQDTFIDHSGTADRLDAASFVHNTAMIQDGSCFTLLHRGTPAAPSSFEPGTGELAQSQWFWPLGGELRDDRLYVFWAQMQNDGYQPGPGDGLGWHPTQTWLAVYDATTMQRQSFDPAPNADVAPIYGTAVVTQGEYTYLFGNTFEQNLVRDGGFANGPHSATAMWLARVPAGQMAAEPEYRTADGWSFDETQAVPIMQRYWTENSMQPRYLGGQWVSVTKVDGFWGEKLAVDVATEPWGPWTTVDLRTVTPRGGDPLMNTYHAHLMPWLSDGALVVSISQNARDMTADAYPFPARYRIGFFPAALVPPPPPEPTTTTSSTTTTTSTTSTSTTTTEPSTTTTSTTSTTSSTTSTTTTEAPTTSSTTSTTTTEPPPAVLPAG